MSARTSCEGRGSGRAFLPGPHAAVARAFLPVGPARNAHPPTALVALVLLTAFVGSAGAQDRQKEEADVRRAVVARQLVQLEAQFDQQVFQRDGNAAGARRRLDAQLALQVEDLDWACTLTDAQKHKLRLAGRGDIKRFFDRCDTVKQKFQAAHQDGQRLQEVWQDISPLQMTLQAGLFQDDSLLHKALSNTLTGEQFARYDALARDRRAFRHRANVELAVTTLEQSMPLRDAQRRELTTLLTNETKPPRKASQYDYYFVMFQIGRLPEGKLKPLFDNLQWKVVSRQLDQFRGMEPTLRQWGLWPVEGDEAGQTDGTPAVLKR
jgi:hypothetical protein